MPSGDTNPRAGKRTVDVPYANLVRKADPDWQREKRNELEYDFSGIGSGKGRIFRTDRAKRWPYPGSGA